MQGFSIYQRAGRPVWYISHRFHEGWKHIATPYRIDDPMGKAKARKLAENRAKEFFAEAPGRQVQAWRMWVTDFIRLKHNHSAKTLGRYLGAWKFLARYLGETRCHIPSQLSYNIALGYIGWRTVQRRNNGNFITRNTALLDLKVMGSVQREAIRRGFALSNPCERMGLQRDKSKEKRELSSSEIALYRKFLTEREGLLPWPRRWMTVSFEIALHQGCRLTETSLPLSAIDFKRDTITFTAKGRNGQPHVFTTALAPKIKPMLLALKRAGATHTCQLPRMAAKLWWDFRRANGLEHTTFHATRVTVITRLAREGVPIQQAMRFVGHADEAVHAIYQKLNAQDLSRCTDAMDF